MVVLNSSLCAKLKYIQMFGNMSDKMIDEVQKAIKWFKKNNPNAYPALLKDFES